MDKQLIYIVGVIVLFVVLMVVVGFVEMGGGGDEVELLNPELLKQEIERSKTN